MRRANSLQGSSIQPGDLKFVDVNGDGVINEDDKTEQRIEAWLEEIKPSL